ncbi:hypothetical protein GCM10027174_01830 [Salinifilum aidingensis]
MSTSTFRHRGPPAGHRQSGPAAPETSHRHHDRTRAVDTAPPVHFVAPETGTSEQPAPTPPSTGDSAASAHHLRSPFIPAPADGELADER